MDDAKALYLSVPDSGVRGDGTTDESTPIQTAIDKAAGNGREGIVFVPSGRYRLTRTIFVWPGVRVIEYGPTRPVFFLADKTPGFQTGVGDMVIFAGASPEEAGRTGKRVPFPPPGSVPPNDGIADANSNTFYSAMSNIDFEIGAGNPAATPFAFTWLNTPI